MKAVCIVLLLILSTAAGAQTPTAGSTTSVLSSAASYYTFEPQDDITAFELSKILVAIMPALTCRNPIGYGCDVLPAIEALPETYKRHFVRHSR